MTRFAKWVVLGVLILVLTGGVLFWMRGRPSPRPPEPDEIPELVPDTPPEYAIVDAQDKGIARISATGVDVEKLNVSIESTANTTIVIPTGTLFTSASGDTQNMMSASEARVDFAAASSETPQTRTREIAVYCISLWLEVPASSSEFTVSAGDSELDPLRKLAQCLEQEEGSHRAKQIAIWMVSDGLKDCSEEELVEKTLDHAEEKFVHMSRAELAEMFPDLDDSVLDVFEDTTPEERGQLYQELRPKRELEVRGMVAQYHSQAGPLLEACGYDLSRLRFFQSDPS